MGFPASWKTPFLKQCFVNFGITLSTTGDAQVLAFTSILLPQLRQSGEIKLNEDEESWIASIVGLALIVGILIVPSVMGMLGRRKANAMSNGMLVFTWIGLALSPSYISLLVIRFLQGLSIGMTSILAPILIGEYTSPKYRGAFLTSIALSISLGVLINHGLTVFFNWRQVSFIYAGSTLLDFIIIICSPETPSFLAICGRYDECRKAFRWLRYPEEEIELEKMIKANMTKAKNIPSKIRLSEKLRRKVNYLLVMFKKKEFYKPVILMFHLHIINEWSASNVLDAYTIDIYTAVIGTDINAPFIMIVSDVIRLITSFVAVIVIRKFKRRIVLLVTISLNIMSFIFTAAHVYAKTHGFTLFDSPAVGIGLIYFHAITISIGSLPLPNILAGEIFSLEYRGVSSMITFLFFCVNMIINMKIALYLFATIGLHGAYLIYAGLVGYGLVVSMIMLPETKDRTLLDIEEEFKGGKQTEDLESFIPHVEEPNRQR